MAKDLKLSGMIELTKEQAKAPANPSRDRARLYIEDNGSGKTRLVVKFPTGAAQVIATEP